MKQGKLSLLAMMAMLSVMLMSNSTAWAYATAGPGDDPSCLVPDLPKPAGDRLKIQGTLAVDVTSNLASSGSQDVDYILRLERNGHTRFFRIHLQYPVIGLSYESVLCRILDPRPGYTPDPVAVQALVNDILDATRPDALFTPSEVATPRKLVITANTFRDAEARDAVQLIPGSGDCATVAGCTHLPQHAGTLADIIIYAVPAN
jgi:hypothetical protein